VRNTIVAVIGAGVCEPGVSEQAYEIGQGLAAAGFAVVTGGLGGVMAAASRGAREAGGTVIGIVPGADPAGANDAVQWVIATGMGDARNAILANTAAAFIAVAGSYGTLSEIAFALRRGKPVITLGSWDVDPQLIAVSTPEQAVRELVSRIGMPPAAGEA